MRSAKDLKDIVTEVRGKSKGRIIEAGKASLNKTETLDTYTDQDGSFTRSSLGAAAYGNRPKLPIDEKNYKTNEDAQAKKIALLKESDKDTIEI